MYLANAPTSADDLARIHAYTALEAIRLGTQLFAQMGKANPTKEQDDFGQKNQCVMDMATLEFVANTLQEHFYASRLTVPESAFRFIRQHKNGCTVNYPGIEATLTALALAVSELDVALDALDDEGSLYKMLLGAFFIVRTVHGFLDSITAGFDDQAAVKLVCAGRPIAPYGRARKLARILSEPVTL